jgi:hypothetical protein
VTASRVSAKSCEYNAERMPSGHLVGLGGILLKPSFSSLLLYDSTMGCTSLRLARRPCCGLARPPSDDLCRHLTEARVVRKRCCSSGAAAAARRRGPLRQVHSNTPGRTLKTWRVHHQGRASSGHWLQEHTCSWARGQHTPFYADMASDKVAGDNKHPPLHRSRAGTTSAAPPSLARCMPAHRDCCCSRPATGLLPVQS